MRRWFGLASLVFATALWSCASAPDSRVPLASDLSGAWRFEVDIGRSTTVGAMQLTGDRNVYKGTLTTNQGSNVLTIRSVVITDLAMVMTVDSPNGEVVFRGRLDADKRSFTGTVTYSNGQAFPMVGRRS